MLYGRIEKVERTKQLISDAADKIRFALSSTTDLTFTDLFLLAHTSARPSALSISHSSVINLRSSL
jgi:hypothetical protein